MFTSFWNLGGGGLKNKGFLRRRRRRSGETSEELEEEVVGRGQGKLCGGRAGTGEVND